MRGVRFLFLIILVYITLFYFFPQKSFLALKESFFILIKILPILLIVIFFNAIINYFFNPKKLSYHLSQDRGIKAWMIALIAGILSHGPMYAWYPLIEDLKKKGLRDSLIALFFYARAVKLPILPLMIHYFGLAFTIVLNIYIIIGAILQGLIVEKLQKEKS